MREFLKDDKLSFMYKKMECNIARYISIAPNKEVRYANVSTDYVYSGDLKKCILDLIDSSELKSINIRSFSIDAMKGHSLVYGKKADNIDEIIDIIHKNCKENKYSILNETIDVNDGGVSGVAFGNIIEFAPNDTPKCVEKSNVCLLEKKMGLHMLKTVYGIYPNLKFEDKYRVEFSLHPRREGILKEHTVIWEYEEFEKYYYDIKIKWPNRFSQFIGDKTFGLILADYLGFNVPYTTVISRNVPPFSFGKETGLKEKWIRTAPMVKEPGKYYTSDKWTDPFMLMKNEELKGDVEIKIASILSQNAVESIYSGGAIVANNKTNDIIEGVSGKGDDFMLGAHEKNKLPDRLLDNLKMLLDNIRKYNSILGEVSIEWVFDGTRVWIVQLNQLQNVSGGSVIVAGNPIKYEKFFASDGLEKLRKRITEIRNNKIGIELIGNVGLCSHFGDVLRQANIPSFLKRSGHKLDVMKTNKVINSVPSVMM